jgi:hypothetical protein
MLRQFAAVAALFALPAFAADEIERKAVTVLAANDDYTPTGIDAKLDDLILIGASGAIITGPMAGKTDPNGHTGRCGWSSTDGALMLRVGSSAPVKAGRHSLWPAGRDGEVKLKVRDTKYSDNRGEFSVDVIRIPHSMKPPKPTRLLVDVANDEWTASDLKVDKGDLVLVLSRVAKGSQVRLVNADARATGTPDGLRCNGKGKRIHSENDGALMMKVGTGEYRRAGRANFMVADVTGPVKFRARLQHPAGNKGTYKVVVFKFPAGTIPASENLASRE